MPNRTQVQDLPVAGLQVIAQPTNQFAQPDIQRKAGGTELLQLAQALSSVNPEMQQVADRRANAWRQDLESQVTGEAAKYKNMVDFKSAADAGQIPHADTPWFMVQVQQNVAAHEVSTAKQTIFDQYWNDPAIRGSDNVQGVVKPYLDDKFGELLQGRNPWELQAMLPAVQSAKDDILQKHLELRRPEREKEMMDATQASKVRDVLGQITPDVAKAAAAGDQEAQGIVQNVTDTIQANLNQTLQVVQPEKAAQWYAEAAMQAGFARRDSSLYTDVLNNVKTPDGKSLFDRFDVQAKANVYDERIHELNIQKVKEASELEHLQNDQADQAAYGRIVDAMKKSPGVPIQNLQFRVDDLPPQAQLNIRTKLIQLAHDEDAARKLNNDQETRELFNRFANGQLDGTLDTEGFHDIFTHLMGMGKLSEAITLEDAYKRNQWGTTDPQLFNQLMTDPNLTVTMVSNASDQKLLDRQATDTLLNRAVMITAGKKEGLGQDWYVNRLRGQILANYRPGSNDRYDAKVLNGVDLAVSSFLQRRFEFDRTDNSNTDPTTRNKVLMGYVDEEAKRAGGLYSDEWDKKKTDEVKQKEDAANKPSQPQAPPPDPSLKYMTDARQFSTHAYGVVTELDDRTLGTAKKGLDALPSDYKDSGWGTFDRHTAEWNKSRSVADGVPGDALGKLFEAEAASKAARIPVATTSLRGGDPTIPNAGTPRVTPEGIEASDRQYIKVWDAAQKRFDALDSMMQAQGTAAQYKALTQNLQQRDDRGNFSISQAEQDQLRRLHNTLLEWSMLAQQVPPSLDKLKGEPVETLAHFRLFANKLDLQERGKQVADYLGIPEGDKLIKFKQDQAARLGQ